MTGDIRYPQQMDYHQILRFVPYRSPWLLLDRMTAWDNQSITVQKSISGADPMMAAHLADGPSIMPGVLYIELVGQATLLHGVVSGRRTPEDGAAVLGRCKGEFLSPAFIGETITAEVAIHEKIAGKTVYEGMVRAGDRLVCRVSGMGAEMDGPALAMPSQPAGARS
ncbi:3-hydroxyacyl-ACP dehydratase FabZ family protein [Achromobacter aloeverae]